MLHNKIQELKKRAAPINYRSIAINERAEIRETQATNLDKRIIEGYLCTWNNRNFFGEKFVKGCWAKSIRERGPESNAHYKITFMWQHRQDDPLALFDVLKEDNVGLYFRTKPLDNVPNADRTIEQIRSGTLNQFSVGFNYVWDKTEYDQKDDSIIIKEATLYEGSVVTIGADMQTHAIRSIEELETLHDETDIFINSLPKNLRMDARKLFARHKSLVEMEPLKAKLEALRNDKPQNKGINYNFLTNNFSLQ